MLQRFRKVLQWPSSLVRLSLSPRNKLNVHVMLLIHLPRTHCSEARIQITIFRVLKELDFSFCFHLLQVAYLSTTMHLFS